MLRRDCHSGGRSDRAGRLPFPKQLPASPAYEVAIGYVPSCQPLLKRELNCSFSSLTDHRSDESSTGYSFMSCSPEELMSASPVLQSFSLNLAAVKSAAANYNCPSYSLSQPKGSSPDGAATVAFRRRSK